MPLKLPHRDRPVRIVHGDSEKKLYRVEEGVIDAVVTDPPYGLEFHNAKQWDKTVPSVTHWKEILRTLRPGGYMAAFGGTRTFHRLMCHIEDAGFQMRDTLMWLFGTGVPKSGGLLKPAWEPIILARRPGPEVLELNVDECRIGTDGGYRADPTHDHRKSKTKNTYKDGRPMKVVKVPGMGRYPSNIVHDGSEEVTQILESFGTTSSGHFPRTETAPRSRGRTFGKFGARGETGKGSNNGHDGSGSIVRFFYTAKASKRERDRFNDHPTVKPLRLMKWLVKLLCPKGGRVLDPFGGSGSTAIASYLTGRCCLIYERDEKFVDIINRRVAKRLEEPTLVSPFDMKD